MPSRRKAKLREDRLFDEEGWFRISSDMWLDPGEVSRKLRFLADANVPAELIVAIRDWSAEVRTAQELGCATLDDSELLNRASTQKLALVTLDADFWSDKKIPLRKCGGLVQIEGAVSSYIKSEGFELLMVMLDSLGGIGRGVKMKSSAKQLFVKGVGDGKKYMYEIKAIRHAIYAREVVT
jgi:hypothetical protein